MNREAWRATVRGVARVRHNWATKLQPHPGSPQRNPGREPVAPTGVLVPPQKPLLLPLLAPQSQEPPTCCRCRLVAFLQFYINAIIQNCSFGGEGLATFRKIILRFIHVPTCIKNSFHLSNEIVGWHHWLNGHEFDQVLGDGKGPGSLAWCKESDKTERLNKKKDSTVWLHHNLVIHSSLDGHFNCFKFGAASLLNQSGWQFFRKHPELLTLASCLNPLLTCPMGTAGVILR